MTVVAVDDTDSRESGTCTTYVAAVLGERLRDAGHDVERHLLVRCNPAVEHKTRGNAAVAVHADVGVDEACRLARETVDELAATDEPRTNPGLVVAPSAADVPDDVVQFAEDAVRDHHEIEDAVELADTCGYRTAAWGNGRGRIGALAAVGAWAAREEWTYERLAYREEHRWGTKRAVDEPSVYEAADEHSPTVWDTVDRTAEEVVCVPHTPGPVLFGIRGDDPAAVEAVADAVESEPIERAVTFVTNQGTDAHVRDPADDGADDASGDDTHRDALADGRTYRVDGVVSEAPETRTGGHVFFALDRVEGNETATNDGAEAATNVGADAATNGETEHAALECVAFEPTKHFRDRVRRLRPGDAVTVCGEIADGTLKLEKFALRDRVETELGTPECPSCGRRMKSAGADQGYRCRDCDTASDGPAKRPLDRTLEVGWYEVPPVARRHVAKPLVRGGFDAATHPER